MGVVPSGFRGAYRVKEIHIGGGEPGTAPSNYREKVEGDLLRVCFREGDAITACQCMSPVFASVGDIQPGGSPVDRCTGALVCSEGSYWFDEAGRLRVRLDARDPYLLWPVAPGTTTPEAGTVTVRPEGTYVTDLVGLGHSLLEPVEGCEP